MRACLCAPVCARVCVCATVRGCVFASGAACGASSSERAAGATATAKQPEQAHTSTTTSKEDTVRPYTTLLSCYPPLCLFIDAQRPTANQEDSHKIAD